jgi:pimeloyl-ACP methyl ester carboxylesterase
LIGSKDASGRDPSRALALRKKASRIVRARPDAGTAVPATNLVPPWPGRMIEVDGLRTYLRETPPTSDHTEAALYVHGLGGSSQNWTDMAGLVAGRLDGMAIDLPGFGRSDPAPRYTVDAFAARMIRVMEYTDRGPVHLVGNSLGGAISVKVAALRPDLVRTLTLISPALPFLDPRRSAQGRLLPLLAVPHADRLAARRLALIKPEDLAQMVLEACFGDPTRIAPQRMAEATEEAKLRYDIPWYADAYVRTLRGLVGSFLRAYLPGDGSLWRTAARIHVPTLVIGGELDRLVDVRVAAQAARVIRGSRLLMLPGIGHVAQMEAPAVVAEAILSLLTDLDAAPASHSSAKSEGVRC